MKELNKTIQNLKVEVETIMKSQRETFLDIENLGRILGIIDTSINNSIQEIEERLSGTKVTIENTYSTVKKMQNAKSL